MSTKQSNWQNIQLYVWLSGGLLCFVVALIFWAVTDTKDLVSETKKIEETQSMIQPEKVAATTNLGGLTDEVRPLQLTTRVVAVGHHLSEFRGTKYLQENQKKWIVELFRARSEDVVKSYLLKQTSRKGLIYFRLSGEDQVEQYVLAYGPVDSEGDAKQALNQLPYNLPASVKPKIQKIDQFVPLVNDLGSDELIGNNKMYAVNLKSAPLPIIDETIIAQQKALLALNNQIKTTTRTTVTRKDAQGNVIDVQRSQSTNELPKSNRSVDNQITDPFN
ncbi:hypothetical protein [Acinetobacter shaoyimingii]|uniref:SPOR domain-containing protein n=1 Tax=Acinetobacter shaoyimingii TaxID=2715164 RepID=A0A6G8RS63_9GAMM|nr:hypothetical protein [Acinetobacter shaoyimingii]NHB56754.1 hypothetical protein [Acinetobacter shaoyimingii]QIO04744.1 hypothetical protein G8E00_01600 [Acinetobacter shaoyimingii]